MTTPERIAVYWAAIYDEVMPARLLAQTPKSPIFAEDLPKSTRIEYIRADLATPAALSPEMKATTKTTVMADPIEIDGWVRRLRKTEEAGHAHHLSKTDRLAIADFLAALRGIGGSGV